MSPSMKLSYTFLRVVVHLMERMAPSLLSEIGKACAYGEREKEMDQRELFATVTPTVVLDGSPLGFLVCGCGRSEVKSKGKPSIFFPLSAWVNCVSSKTLAPASDGDRPTDDLAHKVCQPQFLCSPSLGMVALPRRC